MRIAEAAKATDLSAHTLRFYEAEGLVTPRRIGAIREYSAEDIDRLEVISKLRSLDFSIPSIRQLLTLDDRIGEIDWLDESQRNDVFDVEQVLRESIADIESRMELLQHSLSRLRAMQVKAAWLREHGGIGDETDLDSERGDRNLRGTDVAGGDRGVSE